MGVVRKAVLYTLLVHVLVLGAMAVWPVSEGVPPSETFTEVTMLDSEDFEEEPVQSFEVLMSWLTAYSNVVHCSTHGHTHARREER